MNDNHPNSLHEAKKSVVINVRTPYGITSDYKTTNKVMQGDTWATAMAAAQVDNFGKEVTNEISQLYVQISKRSPYSHFRHGR